jgi:hypothetical protein
MKRLLFLLLVSGGLGLAGCSNEEPPPTAEEAKEISAAHGQEVKDMMKQGAPAGHTAPQ